MSRKALRVAILVFLLGLVLALGIYNSFANARLVVDLERGSPAAFAKFSERLDAYNLLQTETTARRRKIAQNIAAWNDPRAAKTAVSLLQDPDVAVREALINSLSEVARKYPDALARELKSNSPVERAGLIDAAVRSGKPALEIAKQAFKIPESREAAGYLFFRIGASSIPELFDLLESKSNDEVLAAADLLGRLDATGSAPALRERIWRIYSAVPERDKDKVFPALATYAPEQARALFRSTLSDTAAPANLRIFAVKALGKLGDVLVLRAASSDYDERVAAEAANQINSHNSASASRLNN